MICVAVSEKMSDITVAEIWQRAKNDTQSGFNNKKSKSLTKKIFDSFY